MTFLRLNKRSLSSKECSMKRWLSRREMSRSRVKGGCDEGTTEKNAWACAVCSRTRTAAAVGASSSAIFYEYLFLL